MSAWVVTMGAGATMGSCIRRLPFHPKERLGPQSITGASEMAKHNSGVVSIFRLAVWIYASPWVLPLRIRVPFPSIRLQFFFVDSNMLCEKLLDLRLDSLSWRVLRSNSLKELHYFGVTRLGLSKHFNITLNRSTITRVNLDIFVIC